MALMPPLTSDLEEAKAHIRTFGVALIPDQLRPEVLKTAREATYAAAAEDRRIGREADQFGLDYGEGNVRVWNILSRDPIFREIVQLPVVLELLDEVIGWPALLGNISANIAEPGSDGGMWHADQLFVPRPWPPTPQGMNFAWLVDDFTNENGATEIVPKSHLMEGEVEPETLSSAGVSVVAPAGTLMVFESRILHRTGCNRSPDPRAALFAWYTSPIYRTQENWFLSLDKEIVESASDELLVMLGYKTKGLGLVYGRSPTSWD